MTEVGSGLTGGLKRQPRGKGKLVDERRRPSLARKRPDAEIVDELRPITAAGAA